MELLKVAIAFQALSLCQGLQKTISSSKKYVSLSEGTDEAAANQTDAFTPQLSGNCSGTLGLFNPTEWTALLLKPARRVANKICRHFGCKKAVSFSHRILHNATCLTNCTDRDFKLKNCTVVAQNSCTNVTEIVCKSSLAFRLVGGSKRCEGRVEAWNSGKWRTVCDDDWDWDASVVCRQLGCSSAVHVTREAGVSGVESDPIFLDKVNCSGSERGLWDCSALWRSNCTHKQGAGVLCSESPGAQNTTTGPWTTPIGTPEARSLGPTEVGCIVLSLLLVMALVVNAILCWRFRKRERDVTAAMEQSMTDLQTPTRQEENEYQSTDDVHKPHSDSTGNDVLLNPRVLHTQHTVDLSSFESDYEFLNAEPPFALATFKRTDQASGLAENAALLGCHGDPSRFSTFCSVSETNNEAIPIVASFDSSNTSSEECYENTKKEAELHIQEDSSDSSNTSSIGDYENTGKEAERLIQGTDQASGLAENAELLGCHEDPRASLDSSCTSSEECYENTKKEAELHIQDDSSDSSSTSYKEDYENTGKEAERLIREMTGRDRYTQPQDKQPDPHPQDDSSYSSNTSSKECYANIGRESEQQLQDYENIPEGAEEPLCPAVREHSDQSSSDSDYDDVSCYSVHCDTQTVQKQDTVIYDNPVIYANPVKHVNRDRQL